MNARVQTKREVLRALTDHSEQLRELGVKKVGLLGSFVRGEQTSDSDVDLLVQFDPDKKSFDNFMHLSTLLEDVLQRHVEIVTTEALSPYIGPHILREVEYATLEAILRNEELAGQPPPCYRNFSTAAVRPLENVNELGANPSGSPGRGRRSVTSLVES